MLFLTMVARATHLASVTRFSICGSERICGLLALQFGELFLLRLQGGLPLLDRRLKAGDTGVEPGFFVGHHRLRGNQNGVLVVPDNGTPRCNVEA